MRTLTMCYGLPASGKTTWTLTQVLASNGSVKRINKDDLRAMLDAGQWSTQNEPHILAVRNMLIRHFLTGGFSVIVDDTNLAPFHEDNLRSMALDLNATFRVKKFLVPLQECLRRDANRPHPVGETVIREMHVKYLA